MIMASSADFPRCVICGGFGLGLLMDARKICRHCCRQTQALFDPDACEYCADGFVDISPNADGGVLKKVLREGMQGGPWVQEGCPTFVQYIGRLLDGSIFDTTRDVVDGKHVGGTDDAFEFQLGRGKVILGWDIGIATMSIGEIAKFIIKPEYAYGAQGYAPKIEPFETLEFEIELLRFGEPLPRFPTQEELAEIRRQQQEENKRMLEENPPPSLDERIACATEEKEKGNACMATKDYEAAQKHYDSGFVNIFFAKEEWEQLLSQEDRDKVNKIKVLLYLNRSLCKIKLAKTEDALWDCDQTILLDPTIGKGHFRRSLVFIEKIKGELDKEKDGRFWIIDKGYQYAREADSSLAKARELVRAADPAINRASLELERCMRQLNAHAAKFKQDEKKLYKEQIFDRMMAKNKQIQQREEQEALEKTFLDMPALE